jgi:hypothetical protein
MKQSGETFRQFMESLRADLSSAPNDHTYIEAKNAEIKFWVNLVERLKRAYPTEGITDDILIDRITELAVSSLRRLPAIERSEMEVHKRRAIQRDKIEQDILKLCGVQSVADIESAIGFLRSKERREAQLYDEAIQRQSDAWTAMSPAERIECFNRSDHGITIAQVKDAALSEDEPELVDACRQYVERLNDSKDSMDALFQIPGKEGKRQPLFDTMRMYWRHMDQLTTAYVRLAKEALPELKAKPAIATQRDLDASLYKIEDNDDLPTLLSKLQHAYPDEPELQADAVSIQELGAFLERKSRERRQTEARPRKRTRQNTAGRPPRITKKKIKTAVRELRKSKQRPSQRAIAQSLGLTDRALRLWQERNGYASWGEVLSGVIRGSN